MFLFIVMMITREHNILKQQLSEEVASGVITDGQYRRALSPLTASIALFLGGFTASRFYQACGELALKKDQLQKMGDEGGNQRIIDSLRDELANFSSGGQRIILVRLSCSPQSAQRFACFAKSTEFFHFFLRELRDLCVEKVIGSSVCAMNDL